MRFPSLAQFSEPQTVLILLAWLRLFTTGLLLAVIAICWFADAEIVNVLINAQFIIAGTILVMILTVFTYVFRHKDFSHWQLFALLLIDIFCWYGFMLGSGGAINPGMSYLLVLLSIAALSLQARQAMLLTAITVILYALMMNTPPKSHHGHMLAWHLWGMWILFLMNAMIMMVVITLLSRALRDKDKAIAHYREETVRNEQLVSMGTMAANIAHELGTPLSTISILADGLDSEERIIIQQQIDRCKTTLQQLKTMVQKADEWHAFNSSELLEHWQHECLLLRPHANITWQDDIRQQLQLTYIVEQAMLALLDNAVEAANNQVNIHLYQSGEVLVFDIQHDGLKVSEDLLKILGRQAVESTKQSLGLGYYLANASIERLGGRVQISNQQNGVLTRVELPLPCSNDKKR